MVDSLIDASYYLLRVVPIVVIFLILAELISELGLIGKVGFLFSPLTKFAHLSQESGAALTASLLSPTASNAMLMDFYTKNSISKRELVIANLAKSLPTIISEARYMLPSLLPLLGVVGLCYYGLHLLMSSIRTLIVSLYGKFALPVREYENCTSEVVQRKPLGEAFKVSLKNSAKPLRRILITLIPMTLLAFALSGLGVFDALSSFQEKIATHSPIPGEGLPIVAAYLAHSVAAYAIAGPLLEEGILGVKDTLLCLLTGSLLSIITYLRITIPSYLGIFGPALGGKLIALSFLLRSIVTIGVIAGLILLW
jgi:hypothetical protein